jgi:glycosyltransferase involved in cell wall biosynthesis
VEKYLDKCVQSIVDQTYQNLEIILVDDGSPDNCGAMCDAWAEKDSRIKVVHKVNGGLSDARNAGMVIATGEYIGFVDSDDWIDTQMYQCLYEAMKTTDSDIAACGARRVWTNGKPAQELRSVNRYCVLEQETIMEALITSNGAVQTVWNKLYRRNVTKSVLFPAGLIHEDEFWTWQVFAKSKRIVTLKESYYNYLQRDNSIMGAGFSEKGLLVVQAKTERQNYIEKVMPKLTDIGRTDLVYTCMHLGVQVLRTMHRKDAVRYLKYLKSTIRTYPLGKTYLRTLTWKKRLHLRMLRCLFVPVCLLHSI